MSFAGNYFKKYGFAEQQIEALPNSDLELIITIPSFNELNLTETLNSLSVADLPNCSVEVIVIINASENATDEELTTNLSAFQQANEWYNEKKKYFSEKIRYYFLLFHNLPKKHAGVGLARKIVMDEAVRRYDKINRPDGLIVCFDADAKCSKNYLTELHRFATQQPKMQAAALFYEHPIFGDEFSEEIYENIAQYELYLRYYIQALRFVNFPFAFHTVGSSMCVRAVTYTKQGGMNRRQAGEDFYFLQKIIPHGGFAELNNLSVYPSPRASNRVPFGTGATMQQMLHDKQTTYFTYQLEAFEMLGKFFAIVPDLFSVEKNEVEEFFISRKIDALTPLFQFLIENNYKEAFSEIKQNSSTKESFQKRFFQWFHAFKVLKFLNFAHNSFFKKETVVSQAILLLERKHIEKNVTNSKDLLLIFRELERNSMFNTKGLLVLGIGD